MLQGLLERLLPGLLQGLRSSTDLLQGLLQGLLPGLLQRLRSSSALLHGLPQGLLPGTTICLYSPGPVPAGQLIEWEISPTHS